MAPPPALADPAAALAAARAALSAGRPSAALAPLRRLIASAPGAETSATTAVAADLLGVALATAGAPPGQATRLFRIASTLDPTTALYAVHLGGALVRDGAPAAALAVLEAVVARAPGLAAAHQNLGAALHALGRLDEAAACFRALVRRRGDDVAALTSLGAVLADLGRLDQALALLRRAVRLAPEDGEAQWTLATTLLAAGDLAHGWPAFEWRWHRPGLTRPRLPEPPWQGEPLDGRTIRLDAEQGRGDTLQFVRFAGMVAARGGRVVVRCQPALADLVATAPGVATAVGSDRPPPPCAVRLPLMSLARVLGIDRLDAIPAAVPYLAADPARVAHYRDRLAARTPGAVQRVGIAWAGTATHRNDRNRSVAAARFAGLAAAPGVALFSLQVGPRAGELAAAGLAGRVHDLTPDIADFCDSAAIVTALDLVIAVDTALVHLAGALARPVWVALPFAADWRWLRDRTDSPWYPTARLFRQPAPGDWLSVFTDLHRCLADRCRPDDGA